jgi:hypothetical protein
MSNEKQVDLKTLSPLSEAIVNKTIDNVTRKLVGGFRNKKNTQANHKNKSLKTTATDTLKSTSAQSVLDVNNRGVAWKEMIQKSISHGISSLSTMQFDGQFTVKNGQADGLDSVPNKPGVYVVFDKNNQAKYVGDSGKLKARWNAGHLNENKQNIKQGQEYKLGKEFEEGCAVKFIQTDSVETAAAIEAHLISSEKDKGHLVNSKEELKNEQGTRSNQEAKKMKDASTSTSSLVGNAALEAGKQSVSNIIEQLITTILKYLKDELVDIFKGGETPIMERLKRFIKRIVTYLKDLGGKFSEILKGFFEFIINAFSQVIAKVYNLAKNIYELGCAAWSLYKGKETMSREDLIKNISETIIISGSMILWDSLDLIIETNLTALLPAIAPFSPYISATLSAIGFGVTSHYLCQIVPEIVESILSVGSDHSEAAEQKKLACEQLVNNSELNLVLIAELNVYMKSTAELCQDMKVQTKKLLDNSPDEVELHDVLQDVNMILKG